MSSQATKAETPTDTDDKKNTGNDTQGSINNDDREVGRGRKSNNEDDVTHGDKRNKTRRNNNTTTAVVNKKEMIYVDKDAWEAVPEKTKIFIQKYNSRI